MFRLCRLMLGLLLALFITPTLSDSLPGSNSRGVSKRSAVTVETSVAADTTTTNRVNASSRRSAGRDRHSNVVSGASVARTGGNVVQRTGGINSTANNAARIAGRDDFGKTHDGRVERATKNRGGRVSATSSVVPRSGSAPVRAGVVSSGTKERRKNVAASTVLTCVPSQSKTARSATSLTSGGTASLLKICQEQYTQCMDDFCNVLDDELGRCICSKNIKNYTKTSAAQKEAKDALQDVVQQIQYIGLTHDEVVTLLSQTEAELVMQKNTDKSQIKNSLDKIKDMIINVKPRSSSAVVQDTGLSLDVGSLMNFDTGSVSFDVLSLFDGGKTGASISNQRGEQLYKTASAQCKKTSWMRVVLRGSTPI